MAKFKKGDRVRVVETDHPYVKYGATGTVGQDDSDVPFVYWDHESMLTYRGFQNTLWKEGRVLYINEGLIELIEPSNHSVEATEMIHPKPGTLEWWRWHFAGQAMQANRSADTGSGSNKVAEYSVADADSLIAELQKPKEQ